MTLFSFLTTPFPDGLRSQVPPPPAPLFFGKLHILLHVSLHAFYIALPLIFKNSENLKANTLISYPMKIW